MLSANQKYWIQLKATRPDEYERRLAKIRERSKEYRKQRQQDPTRRAAHNAARRQKYSASKTKNAAE